MALAALTLLVGLFGASKATAAPGDPFDPLTPYVFVGQNSPSELFRAVAGAGGSVTFEEEGDVQDVTYNAIGYNTNTNYLYGVANTGNGSTIPTGSVIRIGQDGVTTRVGTGSVPAVAYWGAIAPGSDTLYVSSGSATATTFYAIDTLTGTVSPGTLELPVNVFDLTYAYGFFWGLTTTGDLVRMDLDSPLPGKPVDVFSSPMAAASYGAAWTFGNGNIGVSNNATGEVTQLAIEDPASASPTITVVSRSPGPSSSNNDGAASPGAPTDLSIVKDAPASYDAGDSFTYTVTVTNNGPGLSTGSVVTDLVPPGLSNVQTSSPGCTVVDNQVTCTVGELASGASQTISISVDTPASPAACFTNAAAVLANELDPDQSNNEASVTSCPRALVITKSSDATVGTRVGDTVTYTVTATNTGLGDYTIAEPAVVVDDLAGILDDASYDGDASADRTGLLDDAEPQISWTGALDSGDAVTITYSVTVQAGGDGVMRNVAFEPNDPGNPVPPACAPPTAGGLDPITGEACAQTTNLLPTLSVAKVSDASSATRVGDLVNYTVTATNTGPGDYTAAEPAVVVDDLAGILDDATLANDAVANRPGQVIYAEPKLSWTGALASGDTVTISYSVETKAGGDGTMRNVAFQPDDPDNPLTPECAPPTAGGLDPVTGQPCAEVTNLLPAVTIVKTADRETVTAVGETITYSYVITNVGGTVLAPVTVTETAFSGTGGTPTAVCPASAASLAPGESVTCTASYVATQADVDAGAIVNTAVATGTPPGGPPVQSPPSTVTIKTPGPNPPLPPFVPRYDLELTKSATRGQITVGDTVTYRLFVKNLGPDAADGVRVTDSVPSHLLVRDAQTPQGSCTVRGNDVDCAIGKLDNGQSLTVTVRATALRSGTSTNSAVVVPPVLPPGVPPIDPPANNSGTARVRIVKPQLRVSKTVDRTTLRPGQTATYTVRVTNPSRQAVRNVRTCDRLPSGLKLVSTRPTAKVSRGQHCWTERRLGARKSVTYRITVRALSGASGHRVNVAQATSPDARRGRATRTVRVIGTAARPGGVTG